MQALILTGGLGTRLRPLTLYTPKPLLPIANLPFLSYPLSSLRKHSVRDVFLCTSESLIPYENFVKAESRKGTRLVCSREFRPLGTAGAIKNAQKHIDSSPFFVMNGDVLTDLDLGSMIRFHKEKESLLTIALIPVKDPSSYGLVRLDSRQRVTQFIEKPSPSNSSNHLTYLINGGIYLLEKEILDRIPKGKPFSTERELFPGALSEKIPFYGFVASPRTYWIDIGTPEKYIQANEDIRRKTKATVRDSQIKIKRAIHASAQISKESVLGDGCAIGANTVVRRCVLLDHVTVG
ncbi:MAG: NDP-sugar synthase, partial [Elusimicrobia bacterium]|nr:NDP-sugar synthase [Elusimicrobiota bacterium]